MTSKDGPYLPHLSHLTHSPSQPADTYPAQNIPGSLDTPSVLSNIFMTECILFMRLAFLENGKYETFKYDRVIDIVA
jgi:hypothetical protein